MTVLDDPDEGSFPQVLADALAEVLGGHASGGPVWCGVWAGFGYSQGRHVLAGRDREWCLFTGHTDMIAKSYRDLGKTAPFIFASAPLTSQMESVVRAQTAEMMAASERDDALEFRQSPNLIWPDDRSWCVATDIDQDTTYVGGSSRLVDDLVRCDSLEVHEVRADDGITEDSDRINPPAPERRASIRLVQEKTFWDLELEEDARRLFGSPWWWRSVSRLRTFWRARHRWRVQRSR